MFCFTCNRDCRLRPGTPKHLRPTKLTCRLQERKFEPGMLKPDVTIIEALKDVTDWDATEETLLNYDNYYICHECQLNLRQAVNKKAELENNIEQLNAKICQVQNSVRRDYYKGNYCRDKVGKCWACMNQFVPTNNKNKWSDRTHLASPVVEGMSVHEAVVSLLEEQAVTLQGLYPKKVYICKKCVVLLRNVIRSQCVFDSLQTLFQGQTVNQSVFTQLLNGEEVPLVVNTSKEFLYAEGNSEESSEDTEGGGETSPIKPDTDHAKSKRTIKRPHDLAKGNMPGNKRPDNHSKVRKVSKRSGGECGNSDLELVKDSDREENDTVNLEGRTVADRTVCKGLDSETNEQDGKLTNMEVDSTLGLVGNEADSDLDIDAYVEENEELELKRGEVTIGESLETNSGGIINKDIESQDKSTVKTIVETSNEVRKKDKAKKQVQVKIQLQGTNIKALSQVGSKGKKAEKLKKIPELDKGNMAEDWVIYYYPKFSGRSEFIRLLFEETGTPYKECAETFAGIRDKIVDGKMEGYPHFAPPMIKKGNFQLSQTSVICRYLGEVLGIYPDTVEDKLHAEQISACCHDYIAEGRLAFHGIYPVGSYSIQKEETQPYIDRFVAERLSRWMKYFERVLASNNGGKGFLFGEKLTYCDLSLFHILHATEFQFPDTYKAAEYMPLLKAFKERIASRPRLAAYLKSDRWRGFSGDSMM
ncbi:uncharacterized protein LOC132730183 [Ruditapes philippinarum]|uniref:uncharacterized protein LOC132730183 n=1 Tax=Ruditapes philippinarum TaxID=129788 RepID=UPI00295AAA2F|nr:uncharacterized protein LOC132730183 [Ruditapes philippinarum]